MCSNYQYLNQNNIHSLVTLLDTRSTSHLPKISNPLITRQQLNPFRHRQWLISWSSDHASECGRKVIYSYRITKLDNIGFVKHCMVWWVLISVSTFGQCDQNLLKIKYKPPHITSSGCWWCFNPGEPIGSDLTPWVLQGFWCYGIMGIFSLHMPLDTE